MAKIYLWISNRSSHKEVYSEKGVLKTFTKFTGEHLCWSLFLINLQAYARCFPVKFVKFLRTPFSTEHLRSIADVRTVLCSHFVRIFEKRPLHKLFMNINFITYFKLFWICSITNYINYYWIKSICQPNIIFLSLHSISSQILLL